MLACCSVRRRKIDQRPDMASDPAKIPAREKDQPAISKPNIETDSKRHRPAEASHQTREEFMERLLAPPSRAWVCHARGVPSGGRVCGGVALQHDDMLE
jgi:hypothetical protein